MNRATKNVHFVQNSVADLQRIVQYIAGRSCCGLNTTCAPQIYVSRAWIPVCQYSGVGSRELTGSWLTMLMDKSTGGSIAEFASRDWNQEVTKGMTQKGLFWSLGPRSFMALCVSLCVLATRGQRHSSAIPFRHDVSAWSQSLRKETYHMASQINLSSFQL